MESPRNEGVVIAARVRGKVRRRSASLANQSARRIGPEAPERRHRCGIRIADQAGDGGGPAALGAGCSPARNSERKEQERGNWRKTGAGAHGAMHASSYEAVLFCCNAGLSAEGQAACLDEFADGAKSIKRRLRRCLSAPMTCHLFFRVPRSRR